MAALASTLRRLALLALLVSAAAALRPRMALRPRTAFRPRTAIPGMASHNGHSHDPPPADGFLLSDEEGYLCDDTVCDRTQIFLSSSPIDEPGVVCELQEGLTMDGKPVWACGRLGAPAMSESPDAALDVSDLGLTMSDLEATLDPDVLNAPSTGYESTSRVNADQGIKWQETANAIEAELAIPGLRGQPAGAVSIDLTDNTCAVTVFGMLVWSCVLKGDVESSTAQASAEDGPDMLPRVRIKASKRSPGRWSGFVEQIGEDSILQ